MAEESAALDGLSSEEANKRLLQFGPNIVKEERSPSWFVLLKKFVGPIPLMLEVTIIMQFALGKLDEAVVISFLLIFNSILSFFQEHRADSALMLLKSKLLVQARVMRDGHWQLLPAQLLVPGDIIHLRMGDLVPADARLVDGELLLDQSVLTGESLAEERAAGQSAYAGSTVRRGEASCEVTATGQHTYFGRTAELVQTAKTASHLESHIFEIVKYLVILDLVLVAILLGYSIANGIPLTQIVPFALILLVASIPVALPATFTLATALGARELAARGVLVTHLSAIEEAASMDVLASDKTGTITQNRLSVAKLHAYAPYSEEDVFRFAVMASDDATQDPIDLAILDESRKRKVVPGYPRLRFIPFDTVSKRSEGVFDLDGKMFRAVKGSPERISDLLNPFSDISPEVEQLAETGCRVLAVLAGEGEKIKLAGLIGLQDPPREDSAGLIYHLKELGIRVVMITGDTLSTARAVAKQVGMGSVICSREVLNGSSLDDLSDCDVFAGVFPEDKYRFVQIMQSAGHITGMTGDGVNDAPALKQAEVGIAVSNATDVAKSSASLVLTNPGLTDVLAAVETSRCIYQRMLTYTLNKIIKTLEIAFFLSVGVMVTGVFVITPLLIVLLLFTNDFVTMSLATDKVSFSQRPERWNIPALIVIAGSMATLMLVLSFFVFYYAHDRLLLPLGQLQTLIFVMLVFTGQGNVYLVRERNHFWSSVPSKWMIISSVLDILVVIICASNGMLMKAISLEWIAILFVLVAFYLFILDFLKVGIFGYFGFKGISSH